MKHFFLFIILISELLFFSCRKGPQDPKLSLRSRKTRLIGVWAAQYLMINADDSLAEHFYSIDTTINTFHGILTCNSKNIYTISFYPDGKYISEFHTDQNFNFHTDSIATDISYTIGVSHYTNGIWKFMGGNDGYKKKELLNLKSEKGEETFEIVELSQNKIQLRQSLLYPVSTTDTINYLMMAGGNVANL